MAERKKILIVGPLPPPYHGGAVATEYLLDSSLAERFELIHLDTADRRGLDNLGRFDFTNVRLAVEHFVRFVWLLLTRRPDSAYVPVSQNRLAFFRDCLFLVPARLAGVTLIVHVHGGYLGRFLRETDPWTRRLARWVFRGVDRVIVLGERLRSMLDGWTPPERVAVVPNGMPDVDAAPRALDGGVPGRSSSSPAAEARERTVVYLGTLTRTKGFVDVIEAAKRVLPERQGVRFVLAGSFASAADEAAAREALADAPAAVSARIEFAGLVTGDAKMRLLRGADIFVFPSYFAYEGHPFVILEAMAAGLPIVTTDQGAIAETVLDGENGCIVPQREPATLAAKVLELLDDAALRARFGRASRERFLEAYTLEVWTRRMQRVFEAAAGPPA